MKPDLVTCSAAISALASLEPRIAKTLPRDPNSPKYFPDNGESKKLGAFRGAKGSMFTDFSAQSGSVCILGFLYSFFVTTVSI